MRKRHTSQSAFLSLCISLGVLVFFAGLLVALFGVANPQSSARERTRNRDGRVHRSGDDLVTPAAGAYEARVARYNGPGNGDDEANAITVDTSGNVYVTGYGCGSHTARDYTTIKYNSAGQQQWIARYDGPANDDDMATAIASESSGNVYVTGASLNLAGDLDYATIKYNSAGQEQWVSRAENCANGKVTTYPSAAPVA